MKDLKDFKISELLVRAELDDIENRTIYIEEINSRNSSEEDLNKAYSVLDFVRNTRHERANKPLSIFMKLFLLLFPWPFFISRFYDFGFEDTLESLKKRGFKRKVSEMNTYFLIGIWLWTIPLFTWATYNLLIE